MAAKNFTFKKEPRETGLSSVANFTSPTIIKYNKKVVGSIDGPNWRSKDHLWHVWFWVNDNGTVTVKKLKTTFADEPAARVYLKTHFSRVFALGLAPQEDD